MATDDETPIEVAKNRAWPLHDRLNRALESGAIDEAQWYREMAAVIVPAYLAGDNPRAQSGSDGTVEDWAYKRGLLADAVNRSGTLLDVGCASGYLLETLVEWCRARGHVIEPFGLDIAPELAALARRRLPQWAKRICVGNIIDWIPPSASTSFAPGSSTYRPDDGVIWSRGCCGTWSLRVGG